MVNYVLAKVKFDQTDEDNKTKTVTNTVLIDAMSFTEAEVRLVSIMDETPYETKSLSEAKYTEVFHSDDFEGDEWFSIGNEVSQIAPSGKERIAKETYLIRGNDIQSAKDNFTKVMSCSMLDFQIAQIKKTKIYDVYTLSDSANDIMK